MPTVSVTGVELAALEFFAAKGTVRIAPVNIPMHTRTTNNLFTFLCILSLHLSFLSRQWDDKNIFSHELAEVADHSTLMHRERSENLRLIIELQLQTFTVCRFEYNNQSKYFAVRRHPELSAIVHYWPLLLPHNESHIIIYQSCFLVHLVR